MVIRSFELLSHRVSSLASERASERAFIERRNYTCELSNTYVCFVDVDEGPAAAGGQVHGEHLRPDMSRAGERERKARERVGGRQLPARR